MKMNHQCKHTLVSGRDGFTLLELLLVVIILSAIAFSAVSFINNEDEQFRFEDTRMRLDNIRKAVAGRPEQTLNGEATVSGFVSDIGRLPDNIQELIEQGSLPGWVFSSVSGTWAGWRGPYLTAIAEQSSGLKAFRDGWGNAGDAPNYGWKTFSAVDLDGSPNDLADTLSVQSYGSDGISGGTTDYEKDYPAAGSETIVERHYHQLNLKGWNSITSITIILDNSAGASPVNISSESLRLRVYYPQDGNFTWTDCNEPGFSWPATVTDRDAAPYLSLAFPQANEQVPANDTLTLPTDTIDFGNSDKWVPWGVHSTGIVNDADGCVYKAGTNTSQKARTLIVPRTQLPGLTIEWHVD